jgi:hypothetical protein
MPMAEQTTAFDYHLVRTYYSDPDAPVPPLGCSIQLDDFQVNFDGRQIVITLSGQQIRYLQEWKWPVHDPQAT